MRSKRFSVVLAALDDYSIVEQVHRCLESQTIRGELEIIMVCRSRTLLDLPAGFDRRYPDIVWVEGGEALLLNEARELGTRSASTPFVLFLEDHCLPAADCLEKLLARLEQGWTAVGPAFVNGNRFSRVALAANLLTYGEWMGYPEGGERLFVSGFNSAFRTEVLLERGHRLIEDLVTPSTLQMSLNRQGHRFFFEATAMMAHWEGSSFEGVRHILAKNGRGMGFRRARNWSTAEKIFFSFLTPALAAYRVLRAVGAWWRVGDRSWIALLLLKPLAVLWTAGELRGYWCREPRVAIAGVSEVERNRQRFVDGAREPILKPY